MAEPKKKSTRRRRDRRRAKNKYRGISLTLCPKCGSKILPHHVCQTCGFYRDKNIIETEVPQKQTKTRVTKK